MKYCYGIKYIKCKNDLMEKLRRCRSYGLLTVLFRIREASRLLILPLVADAVCPSSKVDKHLDAAGCGIADLVSLSQYLKDLPPRVAELAEAMREEL